MKGEMLGLQELRLKEKLAISRSCKGRLKVKRSTASAQLSAYAD